MPTLIRLVVILLVLVGLGYGAMFALVAVVEPGDKDVTVRIPARDLMPSTQREPLVRREIDTTRARAPGRRGGTRTGRGAGGRGTRRWRSGDAAARRRMSGAHLVEAFLEMMSAERGAARNTIEAYRRDLTDYCGFLAGAARAYRGRP